MGGWRESGKLKRVVSMWQESTQVDQGPNIEVEMARATLEGIFIKGEINGLEARLLVDTGASICLLNPKIYEEISAEERPVLEPVTLKKVVTADGKTMNIHGMAKFKIVINGQMVDQKMYVANIELDAILGLDYMAVCKAILDIGNRAVTFHCVDQDKNKKIRDTNVADNENVKQVKVTTAKEVENTDNEKEGIKGMAEV